MPGLLGALLVFVALHRRRDAQHPPRRGRDPLRRDPLSRHRRGQLRLDLGDRRRSSGSSSSRSASQTITGLGRARGARAARWPSCCTRPRSRERWERHLGDLAARRPFRDLLCRLDEAPDQTRPCGSPASRSSTRDGSFRGYRGTATDITAELEAQAAGLARCPARPDDRAAQPAAAARAPRSRRSPSAGAPHRDGGGLVPRPRPLQGDQRPLRPRRRRPADQGAAAERLVALPARDRHRGAARRRRVRDPAGRGRAASPRCSASASGCSPR